MKASRFLGNKTFAVADLPTPHAGPGELVLRNQVCGVCGTDVHIYHGEPGSADVNPPVVLGHEYSGEVVEVGEGVTGFAVGDHVTVDPNIYCGHCAYCQNGKKQLCPSMEAIGVTRDGGFAQYSRIPASQAFKLEPTVPWEAAAMAEPLACCLHGIDLAGIQVGDKVCVVGGGAIGLLMVQLAKLSGASQIVLSEPNEKRRQVGLQLGANAALDPTRTDAQEAFAQVLDGGANVVIECVGNVPAVKSAFQFAGKGATVLLFSVPKVDATFDLPLFDVYKKELTIKGSFVNPDTHARAVALINSGKVDFGPIITHRFPLDQLPEAIAMQMSDASIKVEKQRGVRWFGILVIPAPFQVPRPIGISGAENSYAKQYQQQEDAFFAALRNIGDTRVVQYGFQRIPRGVNRALHVVLLVPSIGPIGFSHRSAPEGAVWIGNLQSIAISIKFYLVFVHTFPVVDCLGFRVHRVSDAFPLHGFLGGCNG